MLWNFEGAHGQQCSRNKEGDDEAAALKPGESENELGRPARKQRHCAAAQLHCIAAAETELSPAAAPSSRSSVM